MSLRDDLANINNLCSMLISTKADPEEVVKAFSIRDNILIEIDLLGCKQKLNSERE